MDSEPVSRARRKHTNGWMTVLALGLLGAGFLACLYVLIGVPAQAQAVGDSTTEPTASAPAPAAPVYRRRQLPVTVAAAPSPAPPAQASAGPSHSDIVIDELQAELTTVHDQLRQSQEFMREAAAAQHRTRIASALFLAVFVVIAALIVIQVYLQARAWDNDQSQAVAEVEAVAAQLEVLRDAQSEARSALPGLLQEVGEQPLGFQEEGTAFAPRALAVIDDIDHLAYVGQGRLAFRDLPTETDAAVYLNGLLLSAVAHLTRSDPWTAFARLDQFFLQLSRFPDAVDRRRIAQGYSYRALAGLPGPGVPRQGAVLAAQGGATPARVVIQAGFCGYCPRYVRGPGVAACDFCRSLALQPLLPRRRGRRQRLAERSLCPRPSPGSRSL